MILTMTKLSEGRRPPYIGLLAKVPAYRWTKEPPDATYVTELAAICKQSADPKSDLQVTRKLFSDTTGWAFTRSNLERAYTNNSGWTTLRRKRVAAMLATLPPWPFEPTPTGWHRDGFPEDMF